MTKTTNFCKLSQSLLLSSLFRLSGVSRHALLDLIILRVSSTSKMITMACLIAKKNKEVKAERAFIVNGSIVLEKLIAFCNGRCNPIRNFSAKELKKATNNYAEQQVIRDDGSYKLYKGLLQDRPITVKKFGILSKINECESPFDEIVYASQMSAHKNVLKLLGCCLETPCPILVFESTEGNTLADVIRDHNEAHFQPIPWKFRLKIAVDIANAVAYLHTAFPRPVVHRDIKAFNIFLDEPYTAKLCDFSLSLIIPEGESHAETDMVVGTVGFIAPESMSTALYNEKSDVFSFGVVLLELLTGKKACNIHDDESFYLVEYRKERFKETVASAIVAEGPWPGKDQQLEAFVALALRCTRNSPEDRPTMIEAGKELRQIYESLISSR